MSVGTKLSTDISDEELVRRFQASRDADFFGEIFRRHRKRVYLGCRSFFSDGGAAEDATQETFLRAYQNMHRFLGGNLGGWLMQIARNVCIDQWRRRRFEASSDDAPASAAPAGGALEHASDLRFAIQRIRKEMETLSAEQRTCLELKIDGYSYEETAAKTGLSVEAVKSHLQNGRRLLWLRLEGMLSQLK
ncbi:MAG TPA: RNA polymerase sigma factor [Candidatus Acidoferrum sp.]|nr:RNA polymerase sigma factor [Candidatus Acidoferrum sp.]